MRKVNHQEISLILWRIFKKYFLDLMYSLGEK